MNARNGTTLCLAGWWPDPGSVAGIFILEHVKAIAQHRPVEVAFLQVRKCNTPWPRLIHTTAMEEGIRVHRIELRTPVRRFGIPARLARIAYRRLFAYCTKQGPIDLVHIHVRTDMTEQALPVAKVMGLPVILTEHNSYYHLGIRDLPTEQQARERRAIRTWLSDPAITHMMPVSNDLMRVLERDYGVARDRMTVVGNVAADVFHPGPPPTSDPVRILLAAVWRPPKDHDVFIRALRILPAEMRRSIVVEWTGYGPDMATIQQRCAAELPDVDICFTGRQTKAQIADAMRAAHLFVLPTKADNLPCVVLESHCCGTPVISMHVNGVPELITPQNGLLVAPQDPGALAAAILSFLNGQHLFDRAAIATTAQGIHSPKAIGAAIERVYAQVLGTPSPS